MNRFWQSPLPHIPVQIQTWTLRQVLRHLEQSVHNFLLLLTLPIGTATHPELSYPMACLPFICNSGAPGHILFISKQLSSVHLWWVNYSLTHSPRWWQNEVVLNVENTNSTKQPIWMKYTPKSTAIQKTNWSNDDAVLSLLPLHRIIIHIHQLPHSPYV